MSDIENALDYLKSLQTIFKKETSKEEKIEGIKF